MENEKSLNKKIGDCLLIFKEIGDFCTSKNLAPGHTLEYIIDSFVSSTSFLKLIQNNLCHLEVDIISGNKNLYTESPYEEAVNEIAWQNQMVFISAFSGIEFKMKEIIISKANTELHNFYQKNRDKNTGGINISKILVKSAEVGYLTKDELREILFLNDVRNAAIHNNCIPSKDMNANICEEEFNFYKGKQMTGKFVGSALFTRRLVEIFYNWSTRLN